VVVSRTVRDLVVGSEVVLEDRGSRRLRGVEGDWQLYAVAG
jgi:class 3 adenylate cyclase